MEKIFEFIKINKEKHRSAPFLTYNDLLTEERIRACIRKVKATGAGGFFMHARSGLKTPYLSPEWMNAVEISADECEKLGLEFNVYDEYGWPSGTAGGLVPAGGGEDYYIKWLYKKRIAADKVADILSDKRLLCTYESGGYVYAVFYEANASYVDLMNPAVTERFLELTHKKYAEVCKNKIVSFFTDEPQYGEKKIPYSFLTPDAYKKLCCRTLKDDLPALFEDIDGFEKIRYDYYSVTAGLFLDNYVKKVYRWCGANGYRLTGHFLEERLPSLQVASVGDVMSAYEYMTEPGMDWLGRKIGTEIAPKQVASVAAQTGKSGTISEMYALAGWGPSVNELKHIAEWQFLNGIGKICYVNQYSMCGVRKYDYPPGFVFEQPYAEMFGEYNEYFSKLGGLLGELPEYAPVLLLSPLKSQYMYWNGKAGAVTDAVDAAYETAAEFLAQNHIFHHIGNENTIARLGAVRGDLFTVGRCDYKALLLPAMRSIDATTLELVLQFAKNGGTVFVHGQFPTHLNGEKSRFPLEALKPYAVFSDDLTPAAALFRNKGLVPVTVKTDGAGIRCTMRYFDGKAVLFLLNQSEQTARVCEIFTDGFNRAKKIDLIKDELTPVDYTHQTGGVSLTLKPMQSELLLFYKNGAEARTNKRVAYVAEKNALWRVTDVTQNCLPLDKCEYSIDGGAWHGETPVILLFRTLLERKKACNLKMRFTFTVNSSLNHGVYLAMEDAQNYSVRINGVPFRPVSAAGNFITDDITKYDIKRLVRRGKNVVELELSYYQRADVYRILFGDGVLESELNTLSYDTEIANIYIVGDFGVSANRIKRNGALYTGSGFTVCDRPAELKKAPFTDQGYPFFVGRIRVENAIEVADTDFDEILYSAEYLCGAFKLYINGEFIHNGCFASPPVNLSPYLKRGRNVIGAELFSTLRNMLGPHHNKSGEPAFVGGTTFADRPGWCDPPAADNMWTDDYNLTAFGFAPDSKKQRVRAARKNTRNM